VLGVIFSCQGIEILKIAFFFFFFFLTYFPSSLESIEIMEVQITIRLVLDLWGNLFPRSSKLKTGCGGLHNRARKNRRLVTDEPVEFEEK
jgi:hypothetical protein